MRSKLALLTVTSFLAIAASAPASGGPAILGGTYGTGSVTSPGDPYAYSMLYRNGQILLEKISRQSERIRDFRAFKGRWSLPAVTMSYEAGGLSGDGSTLVLISPSYAANHTRRGKTTDLMVVSTHQLQTEAHIRLDGTFSFDAMSPDGQTAYLVQYANSSDPFDYRVRAYDLGRERFIGGKIVDRDEPDEKMTGQPVSRVYSPDGTWAYTLYGGGEETFIHALDTVHGRAECIDLDAFGPNYNYYTLGMAIDPATGAIVVRDRQLDKVRPSAIVDPTTLTVVDTPGPAVAAAINDGETGRPSSGIPWIGVGAVGAGLALAALVGVLVVRRRPRRTVAA